MMDDYGSWSAASQLLSYCVLPARLLLRPIVHSCSQTIVLPGPASVRETLGGPVTTLLSWPACAALACRFAESSHHSHAPTMQAHPPPAPPMSPHSSACTAQESCAPDRADATPRREAVFVFDLCIPNPEPAITRASSCQHHAENTDDVLRKNRVRTTRTASFSLMFGAAATPLVASPSRADHRAF
jgi:hypothetical protein